MADLSVVMPVYNPGEKVRETIASVLGQSFSDFDFIIVDDGCDEADSAILMEFDDPRIKLIRQNNLGMANARNRGIELASQSRFIAFIDHDDLWEKEKLSKQLELFQRDQDLVLVYTGVEPFGSREKEMPKFKPLCGKAFPQILECNPIISMSSVMVKNAALQGKNLRFREKFAPCDDWDLYINLAQEGSFGFIADKLTRYRLHEANTSSDEEKMYLSGWALLAHYRKTIADLAKSSQVAPKILRQKIDRAAGRHAYGLAWQALHLDHDQEKFRRWQKIALRIDPLNFRAWKLQILGKFKRFTS